MSGLFTSAKKTAGHHIETMFFHGFLFYQQFCGSPHVSTLKALNPCRFIHGIVAEHLGERSALGHDRSLGNGAAGRGLFGQWMQEIQSKSIQPTLVGGLEHFLFSPLVGMMIQSD